ncbi:putative aldehyde dehydrogenase protein [Eutypa lata UCREL1]|uniref:aldehyde dehydrogenase (NAD(+)) n=1 Tax=Eutypa lata (strain UCR-EL1) TaxID=1287681 RepID=M7SU84_EUTLA|nr:putative aldehyde dehydrogenase protein [Eutypa lata UCREL1]
MATPSLSFDTFSNIIDGKLVKSATTRRTLNPTTLEENVEAPLSTIDDINKAVQAAQKAAKLWSETSWDDRKASLSRFTQAFEEHRDEFAQMLNKEQGKSAFWAQHEISTALQFLKGFCQLSLSGETIEDTPQGKITTHYTPLGVVAGLTPWNYPVLLACGKIGPALLTGNAFILKPSPFTPYCGLKLAELGMRFFPPGVFQALSGDDELGHALTSHPDVNMITLTGSVETGKRVMATCALTLKRVTLELGGNDAAIVCADVDPATIAGKIALFAFCNSGQICTAMKRVFVHESIYDQVVSILVQIVEVEGRKLQAGEDTMISPITNEPHFSRTKELFASIEHDKLTVVTGSTKPLADKKGFFFLPTIVDNPPDSSAVVQQEQFAG